MDQNYYSYKNKVIAYALGMIGAFLVPIFLIFNQQSYTFFLAPLPVLFDFFLEILFEVFGRLPLLSSDYFTAVVGVLLNGLTYYLVTKFIIIRISKAKFEPKTPVAITEESHTVKLLLLVIPLCFALMGLLVPFAPYALNQDALMCVVLSPIAYLLSQYTSHIFHPIGFKLAQIAFLVSLGLFSSLIYYLSGLTISRLILKRDLKALAGLVIIIVLSIVTLNHLMIDYVGSYS